MGSCVSLSIPLDQSVNRVSQWLDEKGGYIHNLKKNLVALTTTTEELKAKRDDLSRRVTREEERGLQRLAEIQVWLNRVDTVESRVNDIVSARNVQLQRLCLCGFCSKSLLSSYRYGKSVFLTLREVEKLKSEVYEVIAEEKVSYTHNLEKNLVDLERAMEELKAKRDDFSRRLKREEDRGLTRLSEFQVWLDRVETIENKVNALLSDRDVEIQRFCYIYGEKIILTLKEVEVLKSKVFDVIAQQALTPEVEELPLQPPIIGQETMLDKTWNHLMEDGVGIMGMYGMGGVGKTTLLTQLNNKFSDVRCGFDFVIWIVVSKELQVEKILDEIAQKVDLGGEHWSQKNTSQKGVHLFNFLKKKKFMLFLDDIWEKVDLAEIGVPVPTTQNRCKVAFTTRSQDVCARMGVEHPMEVQCLADNDAFDLFQKKVGQVTLGSDPVIPDLAKIVAKKCCGLPLALNVIGETMSCKRTVQEWLDAIQVLNSNAAEFSGMDDKILPLLKYSYDNLKGAQVKQCLLYCALFPEDARIYKEELIEYWICEGIIDGSEGFEMGENKGYAVIGSLVCASLLMDSGYVDGKSVVCMHDVIREMALWIASDLGIQKEAFIVRAGVGLGESPKVKNWNVARRMSLMHNRIYHLAGSPECLELTTLLLQEGTLQNISSEFFKSMPKLTVLDLSGNRLLHELPEGITESLQFLNLSRTGIRHLALQGLRKLIHLDLEETRQLQRIDGISSLHNLKVLKLFGCRRSWTVTELEALKHLEILTVKPVNEQFLRSHRLMSCTRFLGIFNIKSSGISLPATMDKLREFNIFYGSISEIQMGRNCSFLSLVKVRIEDCESLRELTFLMFAPNLKNLEIRSTNRLEDIINKEKACAVENSGVVPFQKLNELSLDDLQELKNIYWSPLPFPYLKEICVNECPNLKKLPLDSQSCRQGENGLIIRYHPKKWIEGVEWEDQATKTHFLASCKLV